jgi:hypothetical protein
LATCRRTDPDIDNPVEELPYKHWGMYHPTNARDTNGLAIAQECGIANMSEAFKGAWGWNDVRCGSKYVYICRRIRKHHLHLSPFPPCALGRPAA